MRYKNLPPFLPRKEGGPHIQQARWYLKKRGVARRLSALALALVMTLVLAAPAMASGNINPGYEVRIFPNNYTSTPGSGTDGSNRFKAYQIFAGDFDSSKYQPGTDPNNPPIDGELSLIKWGESIPEEKRGSLLYALTQINTPASQVGVTDELLFNSGEYGAGYLTAPGLEQYKEAYNKPEYWKPAEDGESAEGVVGGELTADGEKELRKILAEAIPKVTLGGLFQAMLERAKYMVSTDGTVAPSGGGDLNGSAEVIALVLQNFTSPQQGNTALAQAFVEVVARKESNGSYTFLGASPYETSRWVAGTSLTPGHWSIGQENVSNAHLQAGYYLIIDEYDGVDKGKALSEYIVAVFGSQDIEVKSYAPTVNKVIMKPGNVEAHGGDFEIGEEITFRITGTLPENYDNYKAYRYWFADSMDAGLDYVDNTMKVYAVAPDKSVYLLAEDADTKVRSDGGNPEIKDPGGVDTEIVKFSNLKAAITGTRVGNIGDTSEAGAQALALTSKWKIVIQYQAVLNGNAKTYRETNETRAVLHYSDSVINSDHSSLTTPDVAYIYNFGIDVFKYYESLKDNDDSTVETTEIALSGAGFTLTKEGSGTRYALFERESDGSDTYRLYKWISEEELKDYLHVTSIDWKEGVADGSGKLSKAAEGYNSGQKWGTPTPDYEDMYIYIVTSGSEGGKSGKFRINGLGAAATYTLNEVIIPNGFSQRDPVTVRFGAEYNDAGDQDAPGTLKSLYYIADGGDPIYILPAEDDGSVGSEAADLGVENAPIMPNFGSISAILYYVSGSALLIGAALIVVIAGVRKKSGERDQ